MELDRVNLKEIFAGRKLKKFMEDFDNNQKTPEKGPLYKEEELDTSGEESDQGEQTPLKMTVREDSEGCLGGNGDQIILLPYPLARYMLSGRDFAVII